LRTIGNELEASVRSNQISRMLFWIVWMFTLDSQTDAPPARERGPAHLTPKQRKSLLWFLVSLLSELCNDSSYLSIEDRNGLFGVLELTWGKLGSKGRRDTIVAMALGIQEHTQRKSTLNLSGTIAPPSSAAIRNAISGIDAIYSGIAVEARRFVLEAPKMVGLTSEAIAAARVVKVPKLSSLDKLAIVYSL
jgi:hypothetical protein